jgi:methyl-accepting chemotaxis protein
MLNTIGLKTKLVGGFLFVSLAAFAVGLGGYFNLHRVDAGSVKIYVQIAKPLGELTLLSADFQRLRVNSHKMVAEKDKDEQEDMVHRSVELDKQINKRVQTYEKTILGDDGKKQFDAFKTSLKEFEGQLDKLNKLITAGNVDAATQLLMDDYDRTARGLQKAIEKLVESKMANGKQVADDNAAVTRNASLFILVLAVGGAVFALVLGIFLSNRIVRPIADLADEAHQIASGDLTVQIRVDSQDEIGLLARSFSSMAESLRGTIRQVADTSNLLSNSANQVLNISEKIAAGAEEVVNQAMTVATAGEEMAATSNDIANNCQNAATGALDASSGASDGSVIVDKTVQAMNQIAQRVHETAVTVTNLGERSDQIGHIVGTIEDIADQTNLLALNAAIEAARAGEQGRGFAVVADEVRALAERTTRATKEISQMIHTIQRETRSAVTAMEEGVHEVEQGKDDAARSGVALQHIMEQINTVSMQISQVATAAEEQTATTNEISVNMHQITGVIQQTATGAHQSAAAAAELSQLATELQQLVARFRI